MKLSRHFWIPSLWLGLLIGALVLPTSFASARNAPNPVPEAPPKRTARALPPPQATTAPRLYVDRNAPGPAHDGLSWTTAYTTVQEALDWTNAHHDTSFEIWVAEGIYTPDEGGSHVDNAVTEAFRISWSNVQLYGGFAATETERIQRNWVTHPTVLSGDLDQDGTLNNNAYHVLYLDGTANQPLTETTVIDGFTITGGNAAGTEPHNNGGGLYCNGQGGGHACSPMLVNLTFTGNRAQYGGGLFNEGINGASNPTLINITFNGNQAEYAGGGMVNKGSYAGTSSPSLTNVTFSGNQSNYAGGGLVNDGSYGGTSSPTLTNVLFSGNRAVNGGGGMFNIGYNNGTSSPTLTNVTFSGNAAGFSGGGLYNHGDNGTSAPTLVNCILWGNAAPADPQLHNSNASPTVTYSAVQGGYPGAHNYTVNPGFIAPITATAAPTTAGNYRLQGNSRLINSGNTLSVTAATDRDGNPRIRGNLVDLGAYETVILYVHSSAPGPEHDGLSWSTAYTSVQDALDWTNTHGSTSHEIWVAEGIYTPDEGGNHVDNAVTETFRIAWDNVQLYGGFAAIENFREERNPFEHSTTLSGDLDQDSTPAGNAYHVLTLDGVTNQPLTGATLIDGFTITAGNAAGTEPHNNGGGLYCAGSGGGHACNPTLTWITFSDNRAAHNGGGLFNDGSNGGASSPSLTYVNLSGNAAGGAGGGLYNDGTHGSSSPILINNLFNGNAAGTNGGGLFNQSSDGVSRPALINVTLSGNRAGEAGGGMASQGGDEGSVAPILVNCILWGNAAPASAQLHSQNAAPAVTYSDIEGGYPGTGNLAVDPQFIAPITATAAPTTTGNYHLSSGSPAVNTGNTLSVTVVTDRDNNPRILGGSVDMGAYEAALLLVDRDAPGPEHDGLSWTTAYTSVQGALDWTNTHGSISYEIWVAEGTYTPDEGSGHVNNAVTETFRIAWNNVQLYGGFAATETLRNQRDWTAHPTVLSGDLDQDCTPAANAYHVLTLDGVTNQPITGATVIDGFTITAGNAVGAEPHNNGGGLYCRGAGSGHACSPTLAHVIFSGNRAEYGGGMFNEGNSSAVLTDIIFSDNRVGYAGGGLFNEGAYSTTSSPTLINVIFRGNQAAYAGGGMANDGSYSGTSSPELTNVLFSGNQAQYGGGIFNAGFSNGVSSPALTNVTFSGNGAGASGGGMYNGGTGSPILVNCILWGNTAADSSQIYNNNATPVVTYSDIQGGYPGTGNLDADPRFAAPITGTAAPTTTGDYHLRFGSPAIDAGNNFSVTAATDLDGNPRITTDRVDLGAYEANLQIYRLYLPLAIRH